MKKVIEMLQNKSEPMSSGDKIMLAFAYASLGVMGSGIAVISKGYEYLTPEFYEVVLKGVPNFVVPFFFSIACGVFYKEKGIAWLTPILFAASVLCGWTLYGFSTVAVIEPIGLMKATLNLPLFLLGVLSGTGVIYSYSKKFSRKVSNA